MFQEMVIILQTQHRNANLTSVFIGFDESLKQPAESTGARGSQTQKRRYFEDEQPRFANHLAEAGDDLHFIQSLPGHSRLKATTLNTRLIKQRPLDRLIDINRNKCRIKINKSGKLMGIFTSWHH